MGIFSTGRVRPLPPGPLRSLTDYTQTGELRHIQKLKFWPLSSVLHEKYLLPKEEADPVSSFLNLMLRLRPEQRANAGEMAHHVWLEGIVVQGELDVVRKAEEGEQKKRSDSPELEDAEEPPLTEDDN